MRPRKRTRERINPGPFLINRNRYHYDPRLFFEFAFYFFCALIILRLALTGMALAFGVQSRGWPTVEGKVVESSSKPFRYGRGSSAGNYPDVRYSYHVNGKSYEANRVRFGLALNWWGAINKKYNESSPVLVHYRPSRPWMAVLEPGFALWDATYHVGMILLLSCCAILSKAQAEDLF